MAKKTVKELEKTVKELEKKLKASEEYYWNQVQQEKREKEKLQAELKERDGNLKNLRGEISSVKRILANRNKRILELSPYAELESLENQFDALIEWEKEVNVGGAKFRFSIDSSSENGFKCTRNEEKLSSWWITDLPKDADKLKAAVKEAQEKGKKMKELESRLAAVEETVESLHGLLSKEEPKEEPESEEKIEEEKEKL